MKIKLFYEENDVNNFISQKHIEVIKIDISYSVCDAYDGYVVMVVYKEKE